MKKILIGAGLYGKIALEKYGRENVAYFVDNNTEKIGTYIDGVEIINFKSLGNIHKEYEIVIATKYYRDIMMQLEKAGIVNYEIFTDVDMRYYPTDELIINPYKDNGKFLDDSKESIMQKIKEMEIEVESLYGITTIPNHIEIETLNRCNGGCSFCPVSVKNDTREYKEMSNELFQKIILELKGMDYSGRLALFSNNEPFLDNTIIEKHKYARELLPNARMHLFTNGTKLTLDKFVDIIPYLDELIIDNYNQNLQINSGLKPIVQYCEEHPDLKKKVTIVLRKIDEVLSTRGGDAPNAKIISYPDAKCVLPFKQMIIRPDGKVSLCCNDPLGKNTLADLNNETVLEAWDNPRFQMVRKCLAENGRKDWKHCEFCDVFNLG